LKLPRAFEADTRRAVRDGVLVQLDFFDEFRRCEFIAIDR
jgi:hypothetical protein